MTKPQRVLTSLSEHPYACPLAVLGEPLCTMSKNCVTFGHPALSQHQNTHRGYLPWVTPLCPWQRPSRVCHARPTTHAQRQLGGKVLQVVHFSTHHKVSTSLRSNLCLPLQISEQKEQVKKKLRERRVPSSAIGRAAGFAGMGASLVFGSMRDSVSHPATNNSFGQPNFSEGYR